MNRFGVDTAYFKKKLEMVIRDLDDYKPDELARELARYSTAADSTVVTEPEFNREALEILRDVTSKLESQVVRHPNLPESYRELVGRAFELLNNGKLEKDSQPRLTVTLQSYPESNGKRNWTALFKRVDKWGGLIGNSGGITIDRGECWNRVAYHAEQAKLLIGERDTCPDIMDYGDDIETPEEWKGEVERRSGRRH